jgi:hypothetical protein
MVEERDVLWVCGAVFWSDDLSRDMLVFSMCPHACSVGALLSAIYTDIFGKDWRPALERHAPPPATAPEFATWYAAGGHRVADDVSLSIMPGQVTCCWAIRLPANLRHCDCRH